MLRQISNTDIAVNYWKAHNNDPSRASYQLYESEEDLRDSLDRIGKNTPGAVLCYGPESEPDGVFAYYWQPDDKYLQTVLCMFNSAEIFEAFLGYLSEKHPGYDAWLGFAAQNVAAAEVLLREGYALVEDSVDFRLDREGFTPWEGALPKNAAIAPVTDADWSEYAAVHDRLFTQVYWSSDRLRTADDRWHAYALRVNGKIAGALYLFAGDICEVFGLGIEPGQEDDRLYSAMLSCGVAEACRGTRPFTEIIFFAEHSEPYCIRAAESLGFRRHCMYRCYQKQL